MAFVDAEDVCRMRSCAGRARRERYVGPWLPEPVLTEDGALGPHDQAQQRESVSLAMLARLTPTSDLHRPMSKH